MQGRSAGDDICRPSQLPSAARHLTLDVSDAAASEVGSTLFVPLLHELTSRTTSALSRGEPNPNFLLDPAVAPGIPSWMSLRRHAIALHPLYRAPQLESLGAGLTMRDLEAPLAEGASAFDVLRRLRGERYRDTLRRRYQAFLEQPMTEALRSFIYFSLDARQVRWRAAAATQLARQLAADEWDAVEGLNVTSLACGAAGPVARMADGLQADGHRVAAMHLVDRDPVALAAGKAIAAKHLDPGRVHAHLLDLVDIHNGSAAPLAPPFERHSLHLVDVLGLFEYLPDRTAISLLREVRPLLHPTGAILLANMLDPRPQQDVFEHVIQWPRLVQRSINQLLDLVARAGFDLRKSTVTTAGPDEAVYAVAAIRP